MKQPLLRAITLLAAAALASCGGNDPEPSANPGFKPLSERLNESNGYVQDANGNWVPQSNKRSSFEYKGQSPYASSKVRKKEYKTGEISKRSWWGNKNYKAGSYQGNTDGSRFQKTARAQGQTAREATGDPLAGGSYRTPDYRTNSAREAGAASYRTNSNSEVEYRREVYKQPEIVDWQAQRSMTVGESRGLLGR